MSELKLNIIDDSNEQKSEDMRDPWLIAIIDDEESVHKATTLAMARTDILGKPLRFIHAYGDKEGYDLIKNNPNIAVVLLDVVMDESDSGLKLVGQIRSELERHNIQIILRTGQPGYAPENEVIEQYEINAYTTKYELTKSKLFTALAAAIRSYQHLLALENSKKGLRSVINASSNLIKERLVNDFAHGVLQQISALFDINTDCVFCVSHRPHEGQIERIDDEYYVVATSEKYDRFFGKKLDDIEREGVVELVKQVLKEKKHLIKDQLSGLYFSTPSQWEGVVMLEQAGNLASVDEELLQVFCMNVGLGLENAKFYQTLEQTVAERTEDLVVANDKITSLYKQLQVDNRRMEMELDITRHLQQMVLPRPNELLQIKNLDIAGFMEPATEVGGDYYEVLQYGDRVKIGIGDVTGHGLESGVLMLMVQVAVRTLLVSGIDDKKQFLNIINQTIFDNLQRMQSDKNLSLSLLDYQAGVLHLVGQHEDVLVIRQSGEIERIDTFGLGFTIGLEADISSYIHDKEITLAQGDVVILYTDGITEAENNKGELYGLERLCNIVHSAWHLGATQVKQHIIADVKKYIGDQEIYDDITLLVLKQL